MATLKRTIDDEVPSSVIAAPKQQKTQQDPPDTVDRHTWVYVDIGPSEWKIGHSFTVQYITPTIGVPCLKFTSLTESVLESWPCKVHAEAPLGYFAKVLCMPLRGVLDLLHVLLTGNIELVDHVGYDGAFPKPDMHSDGCYFNLAAIASRLTGMMVPEHMNVSARHGDISRSVTGYWGVYKQPKGPVFISRDTWVDWENGENAAIEDPVLKPLMGDAQACEDSGFEEDCCELIDERDWDLECGDADYEADTHRDDTDRGIQYDEEDDSDIRYDEEDDSGIQYDEEEEEEDDDYDIQSDDTGDDDPTDESVFPLCHSEQLPRLITVIHTWLEDMDHKAQGLVVHCKVPERITLVPQPTKEAGYEYTPFNCAVHWVHLTDDEVAAMNTVTYNGI